MSEIDADSIIVELLLDLECEYSIMLNTFRKEHTDSTVSDVRFILSHIYSDDAFTNCDTIEKILNQLCHEYVDPFNVRVLHNLAKELKKVSWIEAVENYRKKKEEFL